MTFFAQVHVGLDSEKTGAWWKKFKTIFAQYIFSANTCCWEVFLGLGDDFQILQILQEGLTTGPNS